MTVPLSQWTLFRHFLKHKHAERIKILPLLDLIMRVIVINIAPLTELFCKCPLADL